MLIGFLVLLVALTANVWLWGHWSFEKSSGLSLILFLNTALLFYVFVAPILRFFKKKSWEAALRFWPIKISFYGVIVLTIVLCVASFYGLMQYILPIKIFLVALWAFIQWKRKKKK